MFNDFDLADQLLYLEKFLSQTILRSSLYNLHMSRNPDWTPFHRHVGASTQMIYDQAAAC